MIDECDGVDLKTDVRLVGALDARLDMLDHHAFIALRRGTGARRKRRKGNLDIALPRRMHAGRLATREHQAEKTDEHAKRHDGGAHRNDDARHGVTQ